MKLFQAAKPREKRVFLLDILTYREDCPKKEIK